jgi:hypothetical protein
MAMDEAPDALEMRAALPALLAAHPAVAAIRERSCLLLHGSRTIGMARATSDWDLWLLTDDHTHAAFAAKHGTCFIDFAAGQRIGHFQIQSIPGMQRAVASCDMELISELRYGIVLGDLSGVGLELLQAARKPMSDAVRQAWFRYHYVEMRSEHRACDGSVDQHDNPAAIVITAAKALQHAMQAAMVIDREPYRYSKWLAPLAARTPTGAKVVPLVNEAIALLETGALRNHAPEASHPLILALRRLRDPLVAAARDAGIDGEWLARWWLHIDTSRAGIREVSW